MPKINGRKRYIYNEKTHTKDEILSIFPDSYINRTNPFEEIDSKKIICDFILQEKIGEGAYGIVKIGQNLQTGEKVAIKIYDKVKLKISKNVKMIEREINILKTLKHPNVLQLISAIETEHQIFIITEYIKGVELSQYLLIHKNITEKEICTYFKQLISGIEYLHTLGICHRDIKTENLIIEQKTKQIKIIDFGFSNKYSDKPNKLLSSTCGSPCYSAPEMLEGQLYKGSGVDIWSAGVVLYVMLFKKLPFWDETKKLLYKKIIKGVYHFPNNVKISDNAKNLINKILIVNPNKRITIKGIKNHPWIKKYSNVNQVMNIGLNIMKFVIPIDEEIINELVKKFWLISSDIRSSVLCNSLNDITTLYYLMLYQKINQNKKSVADLRSDLFLNYIKDKKNLLSNYKNQLENVINSRKYGIENEITNNIYNKNDKNDYANNSHSDNYFISKYNRCFSSTEMYYREKDNTLKDKNDINYVFTDDVKKSHKTKSKKKFYTNVYFSIDEGNKTIKNAKRRFNFRKLFSNRNISLYKKAKGNSRIKCSFLLANNNHSYFRRNYSNKGNFSGSKVRYTKSSNNVNKNHRKIKNDSSILKINDNRNNSNHKIYDESLVKINNRSIDRIKRGINKKLFNRLSHPFSQNIIKSNNLEKTNDGYTSNEITISFKNNNIIFKELKEYLSPIKKLKNKNEENSSKSKTILTQHTKKKIKNSKYQLYSNTTNIISKKTFKLIKKDSSKIKSRSILDIHSNKINNSIETRKNVIKNQNRSITPTKTDKKIKIDIKNSTHKYRNINISVFNGNNSHISNSFILKESQITNNEISKNINNKKDYSKTVMLAPFDLNSIFICNKSKLKEEIIKFFIKKKFIIKYANRSKFNIESRARKIFFEVYLKNYYKDTNNEFCIFKIKTNIRRNNIYLNEFFRSLNKFK